MEATPEFLKAAKANCKDKNMKNYEKYKIAKEASKAYRDYISEHGCTYPRCRDCDDFERNVMCQIKWLYAESEQNRDKDENLPGQMEISEFIGE